MYPFDPSAVREHEVMPAHGPKAPGVPFKEKEALSFMNDRAPIWVPVSKSGP